MIKIEEILKGIDVVSVTGKVTATILSIEFDSRKVTKGSLFVAVKGYKSDGHDFIDSVVKSGASAVICETLPVNPDKNICWIKTTDSAKALGLALQIILETPLHPLN